MHGILFSDNIPSPLAHRPVRGILRSDEDTEKELRAEESGLLMTELCLQTTGIIDEGFKQKSVITLSGLRKYDVV